MAKEKEAAEAAPKKGNAATVSRYKKGLEKAQELTKKGNAKIKELRANGRFGRAAVDGVEAFVGGGIGGALDGFGLDIPIGETRKYAYFEIATNEQGAFSGFVDRDGDKVPSLGDAERGIEELGPSIPAALPLGIVAVAGGAWAEQADAVELGKGMLGYAGGRLASDAAKAVKAMF